MRAERHRTVGVRVPLATLATLVGVAGLLAGCATRHSPPDWLPYAQQAQREAWGGWIQVQLGGDTAVAGVSGELLAISPDSMYTLRDSTVTVLPLAGVTRATLEYYDPKSKELAQMTLAGTFLTLTHGWWLIITAPLWVIVGSSSTAALSHDGLVTWSREGRRRVVSWKDLSIHARFPQGIPPGLDRTALHERPRRGRGGKQPPWPGTITTR